MSAQLAQLAVVHWALVANNTAYTLDRMYNELHDPEIHNIVAELREIQSHLNDLDLWFQDQRILRLMPRETKDIEIGITACSTSIRTLDEIVKNVTTMRRGDPTSQMWGEIKATFTRHEAPLGKRLNDHRVWLTQLFPILKMHFIFSRPQNRMEMERLQSQIRYAAAPPSPQSPTGFVPFAPWPNQSPQQQMYRQAVGGGPSGAGPAVSGSSFHNYPSPPTSNSSNNSPQSARTGFTLHFPSTYVNPPQPPQPHPLYAPPQTFHAPTPASPPDSDSQTYFRPPSRSSSHKRRPSVSDSKRRRRPPSRGPREDEEPQDISQCFGKQIEDISYAEDEQEILVVDFEPNLMVALHRNSNTHAARIVCSVDQTGSWVSSQRGGVSFQGSIKVNALLVRRESKYVLLLLRREKLWARLVFSDFENMVFFTHAFVALRALSPSPDPVYIANCERWLGGEESLWSGYILYNDQPCRLHLLQDGETRAVRVAAILERGQSAMGKEVDEQMEGMTLFTVFIHENMRRQHWFVQESCDIILFDMGVSYFTMPIKISNEKEFPLKFMNARDATDFRHEIEYIARELYD